MIRVALPYHLRNLAGVPGEVELALTGAATLGAVLDELEARYPALSGTIREHGTLRRRPLIRLFACRRDLSFEPADALLPEAVIRGEEPLRIVGAMAGG
ncbi:MAG TPA: MoaD/ThiS family protein [Steroidobacteraceae bacterium]|nr:MoaD/ThiS family protein [Steroidobacteraceae bacterium]